LHVKRKKCGIISSLPLLSATLTFSWHPYKFAHKQFAIQERKHAVTAAPQYCEYSRTHMLIDAMDTFFTFYAVESFS
jgi:hypothetical protein